MSNIKPASNHDNAADKKEPLQYDVKAGLEQIKPFNICGVSAIISNEGGKAAEAINDLWMQFFAKNIAPLIKGRENDVIYAVYSDYEGDHTKPYRLTIGYKYKIPAANENMEDSDFNKIDGLHNIKVQGGNYASLAASGEQPQSLIDTWQAVWQSDLNRSFNTDFELYGPRFFEEGLHEVLVYIGINK